MTVILASASPRRKELLMQLLRDFVCAPTHIDETARPDELPADYVLRLAREKALAAPEQEAVIISADTTVALDQQILGKPESREHARDMLSQLADRTHLVHTGVAVRRGDRLLSQLVSAQVSFAPLSPVLIESYLDTDEPWDKAGAYGIQGRAGSFVRSIDGSYSAVVGLPLLETRELLADFGILPDWSPATGDRCRD